MLSNSKTIFLLLIDLLLGILIGHFITHSDTFHSSAYTVSSISSIIPSSVPAVNSNDVHLVNLNESNVHIVNLTEPIYRNFSCIKPKTLLHFISTSICLHEKTKDQYVSGSFRDTTSIWEEEGVTRILQYLLRHPHLDFIDIGSNIGTYTMYVAALGRFVLAIDCFAPNVERIHRAVQLANVANRVVLVQNAIFTRSGEYLRLSKEATNVGGQELDVSSTNHSHHRNATVNNPYIVKTIKLDELLPVLVGRGVRGAIMKIDIEGSESFVVESGSRMFDTLDIPFIQMEWLKVRQHSARVKVIFDFFAARHYDPQTFSCQLLDKTQQMTWPGDIVWIKSNISSFC